MRLLRIVVGFIQFEKIFVLVIVICNLTDIFAKDLIDTG